MKIAVLVSGSGTILDAMIKAEVPIAFVLADKPCRGIEIAKEAGIETAIINRNNFGYRPGIGDGWRREGFTWSVVHALQERDIDLVAMAGFKTVFHRVMFTIYKGRVLNIHPALLPLHPGEFAVRDTLAAGDTETGSTIHIATKVLDDPTYIVAQRAGIRVMPGDDESSLWERIKVMERQFYPSVLYDILDGTIDLQQIMSNA